MHRKIELHHLGAIPLTDLETVEYDDLGEATAGAYQAFLDSRFASMTTRAVEVAFSLQLPEGTVRGRVDAVFGGESWEIVDYKSGRPSSNPARMVQLQAYAVAADRGLLGPAPSDMTVTFAYLGGGLTEERHEVDEAWIHDAEVSIRDALTAISSGAFDPTPSAACRSCDFAHVCAEGAAWLSAAEEQD